MSRIGFRPVPVPAAVQNVTIDGRTVTVTGPKGELSHQVPEPLTVERDEDGSLVVRRPDDEQDNRALHGLTRTDRKSTRLNSSHVAISYAVFCLKKKKKVIEIILDYDSSSRF